MLSRESNINDFFIVLFHFHFSLFYLFSLQGKGNLSLEKLQISLNVKSLLSNRGQTISRRHHRYFWSVLPSFTFENSLFRITEMQCIKTTGKMNQQKLEIFVIGKGTTAHCFKDAKKILYLAVITVKKQAGWIHNIQTVMQSCCKIKLK